MATPRPQAPPLTSVPSTPGLEVPGGYPRNSTVFSNNLWDNNAERKKTGGAPSSFLTAAKNYLPTGVASYFPDVPTDPVPTPSTIPSPGVHTPYPREVPPILNTDGTVASDMGFSTRAYAGSGSSRLEPASPGSVYTFSPQVEKTEPQSDLESVAVPVPAPVNDAAHEAELVVKHDEADQREHVPRPRATSGLKPSHPGVAHPDLPPLTHVHVPTKAIAPSVTAPSPPLASPDSTSSGGTTSPSTAPSSPLLSISTPPTSPTSPPSSPIYSKSTNSKLSVSSMKRFASLRRGKAAPPPSSFHARGGSVDVGRVVPIGDVGVVQERGGSLDSASPSPASNTTPASPSRRKSLLKTIRGEAKLITGRLRGDPAKVEEGRRLLNGEA
ncbi:hypothetical protein FB45DRAFT_1054522 [Roridomyces roridus]|uniref:Uncharacterized protein n=1 Tax=Roridomyces roridus TaxID=1738132 RepID=A0AAD7C9C0_9AGAR|nr:hypothetical protein FB45DRAFT_1054522 [Roridomyces roridus]